MAAHATTASEGLYPLPKDLVEMQLNQIDLLLAMYASPEEISAEECERVETLREAWRAWCDDPSGAVPRPGQPSVDVRLSLRVTPLGEEERQQKQMELDVVVPMTCDGVGGLPSEPPLVRVKLQQPPWLRKSELAEVQHRIPADEDMSTAIESTKEAASAFLAEKQAAEAAAALLSEAGGGGGGGGPDDTAADLVRVWFYFPSISTRAKRDDLVRQAPTYGLTGFLLAGKPGILCVEGGARRVDEYMRFIKTESWGDIPAHQKKVSERYREEDLPRRAFNGMCEITDDLGERRGERANRGDMKALEAWLAARGLGDAMTRVLI